MISLKKVRRSHKSPEILKKSCKTFLFKHISPNFIGYFLYLSGVFNSPQFEKVGVYQFINYPCQYYNAVKPSKTEQRRVGKEFRFRQFFVIAGTQSLIIVFYCILLVGTMIFCCLNPDSLMYTFLFHMFYCISIDVFLFDDLLKF